jgi:hypothetical protein
MSKTRLMLLQGYETAERDEALLSAKHHDSSTAERQKALLADFKPLARAAESEGRLLGRVITMPHPRTGVCCPRSGGCLKPSAALDKQQSCSHHGVPSFKACSPSHRALSPTLA